MIIPPYDIFLDSSKSPVLCFCLLQLIAQGLEKLLLEELGV